MIESQIPWKWTRRFAVSLTISVAAFSAWGALAPHIPMASHGAPMAAGGLMAALYGNSQGLANCMAANARRAWASGSGFRLPTLFFTSCFVGFALLSMSGLHSAWEYVKANSDGAPLPDDGLMRALFFFVAFSEPAMNYGVEALKGLYKAEERADEREILAAAAERESRQRNAETRRRGFHTVAAPMAAMAMAAVSAAESAADAAPGEFPLDPISRSASADPGAEAHDAHGWRGPRDNKRWERFVEGQRLGLSGAQIVRETGIPPTTIYRWRKLLTQSQREVRKAAQRR
jgi:hypothetical protein